MTNKEFEKALQKHDPCLFVGYGKHGYLTVYHRIGERLKPHVVMNLYIAPSSHTVDYNKKMDSWSWKSDWLQRVDDYNKEVEMKNAADEEERVMYETADTVRYWKKHFDGEEGTQSYVHSISKKVKDASNG